MTRPPQHRGAPEALLTLTVAGAVFVASSPFLSAFEVPAAWFLLVVASAGSTLTAWSGARVLRVAAPVAYLLSGLGLLVLLAAASGLHPSDIAAGAANGPRRLVTETLPLAGPRALLAAPLLLVWTAGAATTELLARRPLRSGAAGHTPVALTIPLALYAASYAAASSAPGADSIGGPLMLVLTALIAVVNARLADGAAPDETPVAGRYRRRLRSAATGVLAVGLLAAALALAGPHVPDLARVRTGVHRSLPTASPVVIDPLDAMAQLRDSAAAVTPELDVTLSAPSDGYLAMADMDHYDGAQWTFADRFEPTGGRIPGPQPGAGVTGVVGQDIVVTGTLPSPLLPALDRPLEVSGLAVSADRWSATFVARSGPAPVSYHVSSRSPLATLAHLSPADGLAGAGPADGAVGDLELPPQTSDDLAAAERYLAAITGVRPAPTVAFLQTALTALADHDRRVVPGRAPTTPSGEPMLSGGTSLSAVMQSVTVRRSATPEQFATFFAMTARHLGVPARVVTGFRIAARPGSGVLPAGRYRVTSAEAWAWVEIPVAGWGWVVTDPTPDATAAAGSPPPETAQAPATTLPPLGATVVPKAVSAGGHALAPAAAVGPASSSGARLWPAIGTGVIGIVALLVLAGPTQLGARRAFRRRARRRGPPPDRAIGAWLELLDAARRAGMIPGAGATATEVATEIGHHFGAGPVAAALELASVADRAVFSVREPPTAAAADRAWELEGVAARSIQATLTRRQRLGVLVRR